jgi:hypothetical protein
MPQWDRVASARPQTAGPVPSRPRGPFASILALQQTAGNQAVADLLHPAASTARATAEASESVEAAADWRRRGAGPVGMGDVKAAEARLEDQGRARLRALAGVLVDVQLKADALAPQMTEGNLALQQAMLTGHIDRMVKLLMEALQSDHPDPDLVRAVEVGSDAAGLAADLMYLDRLATSQQASAIARGGANQGLAYTWEVMRGLADDPRWAVRQARTANWDILNAESWRDDVAAQLPRLATMRAGVTAAQVMDFAVNAPELLATGNSLLARLAAWLTEGGGGGAGAIRMLGAGAGPGTLVLATASGTRALTAAEVEALRAAGLLSGKAYAVYMVAQGGGAGAPPGGGGPSGGKGAREQLRTDEPNLRGVNLANPKTVKKLIESLAEKGYKVGDNPALLLETNLYGNRTIKLLVDGNNRFAAARALNMTSIEVVRISEAEFAYLCERAGLNPMELIQHSIKL